MIRSIDIEHSIPSPMTFAVEVTIELVSGERRWCFFCTPDSLNVFGDFLPDSNIRVHAASPHMIVLSEVTTETIHAAVRHLEQTGNLLNATRPIEVVPTNQDPSVWVFNGSKAIFPSGIFTSRAKAEDWIAANGLEGTLTRYPLDISAYEYAVSNGWFEPKSPGQTLPAFIQRFTSASQEHYHYEARKKAE